jgi:hypothetical protein
VSMIRALRVPLVFETFCCEHFALSRQDIRQWWRALALSHGSQAIALRGTLQYRCVRYRRTDLAQLLRAYLSPRELVEVLETLVEERRLSRQFANRVQNAVLQRVGPTGAWR